MFFIFLQDANIIKNQGGTGDCVGSVDTDTFDAEVTDAINFHVTEYIRQCNPLILYCYVLDGRTGAYNTYRIAEDTNWLIKLVNQNIISPAQTEPSMPF